MKSILEDLSLIEEILDKANQSMYNSIYNKQPEFENQLSEYEESYSSEFVTLPLSERINLLYRKLINNSYPFTANKLVYLRTAHY